MKALGLTRRRSGAALGGWSWGAFARLLGVVDTPVVPVASLIAVCAGSLLVAGALACIPGVIAGRTAPAAALRHE